jgi:hypothetical protein
VQVGNRSIFAFYSPGNNLFCLGAEPLELFRVLTDDRDVSALPRIVRLASPLLDDVPMCAFDRR